MSNANGRNVMHLSVRLLAPARLLLAAATCMLLAMVTAPADAAPPAPREDRVLALTNGDELRYGLHLPEGLGDGPVPLIVGLHYAWGRGAAPPPYYGRDYMNILAVPALAELGAIIVAPDCPGRGWGDPRSDAAVMALIESVQDEFNIDASRIVVTGFSMGGMGTWSFVANHPELVSAAVPVAGRPTDQMIDGWGDTPVFAVHSEKDEVVPFGPTQEGIATLRERGVNAELVVISDLTHFQTPSFAPHLRKAVAWINEVWADASR